MGARHTGGIGIAVANNAATVGFADVAPCVGDEVAATAVSADRNEIGKAILDRAGVVASRNAADNIVVGGEGGVCDKAVFYQTAVKHLSGNTCRPHIRCTVEFKGHAVHAQISHRAGEGAEQTHGALLPADALVDKFGDHMALSVEGALVALVGVIGCIVVKICGADGDPFSASQSDVICQDGVCRSVAAVDQLRKPEELTCVADLIDSFHLFGGHITAVGAEAVGIKGKTFVVMGLVGLAVGFAANVALGRCGAGGGAAAVGAFCTAVDTLAVCVAVTAQCDIVEDHGFFGVVVISGGYTVGRIGGAEPLLFGIDLAAPHAGISLNGLAVIQILSPAHSVGDGTAGEVCRRHGKACTASRQIGIVKHIADTALVFLTGGTRPCQTGDSRIALQNSARLRIEAHQTGAILATPIDGAGDGAEFHPSAVIADETAAEICTAIGDLHILQMDIADVGAVARAPKQTRSFPHGCNGQILNGIALPVKQALIGGRESDGFSPSYICHVDIGVQTGRYGVLTAVYHGRKFQQFLGVANLKIARGIRGQDAGRGLVEGFLMGLHPHGEQPHHHDYGEE